MLCPVSLLIVIETELENLTKAYDATYCNSNTYVLLCATVTQQMQTAPVASQDSSPDDQMQWQKV